MIDKLEQENRVFEYMVHDKLPAEIEAKRKLVVDLQKVLSLPAFDQKDLQQLQDKVAGSVHGFCERMDSD